MLTRYILFFNTLKTKADAMTFAMWGDKTICIQYANLFFMWVIYCSWEWPSRGRCNIFAVQMVDNGPGGRGSCATHVFPGPNGRLLHTVFSYTFLWMKSFVLWQKFAEVFSNNPINNNPALVYIMTYRRQAIIWTNDGNFSNAYMRQLAAMSWYKCSGLMLILMGILVWWIGLYAF